MVNRIIDNFSCRSANTMSSVLEVLGLSLPYSASTPATYAEKKQECIKAAGYLKRLLALDLKPKYGSCICASLRVPLIIM